MRILWILTLACTSYTVAYYPVFLVAKAAAIIYYLTLPTSGSS